MQSYPQIAEVQIVAGRLFWAKGDPSRAQQAFARALELDPASLEALEGLIGADLYSKTPGAARARLEASLAKMPETSKKWVLAGRTYHSIGQTAEAEKAFRKAIQLDPSNMEAYGKLGIVYMTQKRLDEALKEYDAAAEKNPKSVGAFTMAGIILTMQNKPDEARKRYDRALAADPDAPVAANNLAWIMTAKDENLDVALKLAQTAKSKLPKNAEVSDTIGWIYYRKGLANLAVANLTIGIEQDPSNPLIHYHLGLAHMLNKTPGEGRKALERALKINPQFEMADDARRVLAGS
jgi:tetratricopeptide (TPR) repeat protein